MAYRVGNPETSNRSTRQALGIKLSFNDAAVFTQTYTTLDMYKANLVNYFSTSKGERYLNPVFGITLQKYLFEQSLSDSDKKALESEIREDIYRFFPRLEVTSLEILQDEESHTIQIRLSYGIINTELKDELTVNYN